MCAQHQQTKTNSTYTHRERLNRFVDEQINRGKTTSSMLNKNRNWIQMNKDHTQIKRKTKTEHRELNGKETLRSIGNERANSAHDNHPIQSDANIVALLYKLPMYKNILFGSIYLQVVASTEYIKCSFFTLSLLMTILNFKWW